MLDDKPEDKQLTDAELKDLEKLNSIRNGL